MDKISDDEHLLNVFKRFLSCDDGGECFMMDDLDTCKMTINNTINISIKEFHAIIRVHGEMRHGSEGN